MVRIKILVCLLLMASSAFGLPNDCAIVAAEASARLRRAGLWSRVLAVTYSNGHQHRLCIWKQEGRIQAYDRFGALDLNVRKKDAWLISQDIAGQIGRPIVAARFVE